MIVVGVDAHKQTHTLVAVDEVGRKLGERTVSATRDGHLEQVREECPNTSIVFVDGDGNWHARPALSAPRIWRQRTNENLTLPHFGVASRAMSAADTWVR